MSDRAAPTFRFRSCEDEREALLFLGDRDHSLTGSFGFSTTNARAATERPAASGQQYGWASVNELCRYQRFLAAVQHDSSRAHWLSMLAGRYTARFHRNRFVLDREGNLRPKSKVALTFDAVRSRSTPAILDTWRIRRARDVFILGRHADGGRSSSSRVTKGIRATRIFSSEVHFKLPRTRRDVVGNERRKGR